MGKRIIEVSDDSDDEMKLNINDDYKKFKQFKNFMENNNEKSNKHEKVTVYKKVKKVEEPSKKNEEPVKKKKEKRPPKDEADVKRRAIKSEAMKEAYRKIKEMEKK